MYNTEYKLYQLDKTGYQGHQFGFMNVLHGRPDQAEGVTSCRRKRRGTGFAKIRRAPEANGSPEPIFETDEDRHHLFCK